MLTVANLLQLALRLSLVLDTNGAAASWWIGCHCCSGLVDESEVQRKVRDGMKIAKKCYRKHD